MTIIDGDVKKGKIECRDIIMYIITMIRHFHQ